MMTRRDLGRSLAAAPWLGAAAASGSGAPRDLLGKACSPTQVRLHLLTRNQWRPFPPAADRAGWEALPPAVRKRYVDAGEKCLAAKWPALPATLFLGYVRTGNRSEYERESFARRSMLRALVFAEAAEGKGRFLDQILNGLWAICEETYWGVPAHIGVQKAGPGLPDEAEPTMDLFAGETGALLAWALYFHGPALDGISKLIRERIHLEVDRRILTPCLERGAHWMTLGMNWNPWCNSNWTTCNLLLERDEKRREAALAKSAQSVDHFLNAYGDDGGCDEGPGYWGRAGGALFDWLELVHSATDGKISIYEHPLVAEIGRYIYRAHIGGDWFINFADASAKTRPNGALVYRYGRRVADEPMAELGAWLMERYGDRDGDLWLQFHGGDRLRTTARRAPLVRDVWLKDIQVMTARQKAGSTEGFYIAALGGHNAEAHNHNDVGSFVVFYNGEPVIVDAGVETYTAKTFSKDRYTIWTMQSAYHNLPTINGVMQKAGREFAASNVSHSATDECTEFALNLEKAYPVEAGIETWRRTLKLDRRAGTIVLTDRYAMKSASPQISVSFIICRPPRRVDDRTGIVDTAAGPVRISYEGPWLEAEVEPIPITDSRLGGVWGDRLYRVLLKAGSAPQSGEWRITFSAA
jgi:hypothetical protein